MFWKRKKYPEEPGWKKTDTSRQAAKGIADKAPTIREQVLQAIRNARGYGMTGDEAARELNLCILSVRPRLSELVADDKIMDGGMRRPGARTKDQIVWRAR